MIRLFALIGLMFAGLLTSAHADRATIAPIIAEFATAKGFKGVEAVIEKLAATGDPDVGNALRALSDGNLRFCRDDSAVFIVEGKRALDPISREPVIAQRLTRVTRLNASLPVATAMHSRSCLSSNPAPKVSYAPPLMMRRHLSKAALPFGQMRRTYGTAFHSARCCCWRPSVSPSPSVLWASSIWPMAKWACWVLTPPSPFKS